MSQAIAVKIDTLESDREQLAEEMKQLRQSLVEAQSAVQAQAGAMQYNAILIDRAQKEAAAAGRGQPNGQPNGQPDVIDAECAVDVTQG